jgi:hypothetical protein
MSINYNQNSGDETIEITIRDGTGRRIDRSKFRLSDKHIAQKILSNLMEKYALMGNGQEYFHETKDI